MMSESEARRLADEFAQQKVVDKGYSWELVPTRQVSKTDWGFGYALVTPEGTRGTPMIVLVDKSTGYARTLQQAISEGWGRR